MASIRVSKVGRPPKRIDLRLALDAALREEATEVKRDFEATAEHWERKPTFVIKQESPLAFSVSTENEIYGYMDRGTKKHRIRAKRGKTLRFNTAGFVAKSKPNSVISRKGSPAGPPPAFPMEVMHPGTKARRYTKLILVKMRRRFAKRVQRHINKGVKSAVKVK